MKSLKPIAIGVATVAALVAAVTIVLNARGVSGSAGRAQATDRVAAGANVNASSTGTPNTRGEPPRPGASHVRPPQHASERDDDKRADGGDGRGNDTRQPVRNRMIGRRQDRVKNGVYTATFAGFFSGTGKADVNAEKISITASLTTTDGRTGDLIANNLTVEGPYFNGTGTVLGETVQISGRVDAARASRLTATIFAGDGRASRAVANLPGALDAGDDDWEQSPNHGSGSGGGGSGGGGSGGGGGGTGNPAGGGRN